MTNHYQEAKNCVYRGHETTKTDTGTAQNYELLSIAFSLLHIIDLLHEQKGIDDYKDLLDTQEDASRPHD